MVGVALGLERFEDGRVGVEDDDVGDVDAGIPEETEGVEGRGAEEEDGGEGADGVVEAVCDAVDDLGVEGVTGEGGVGDGAAAVGGFAGGVEDVGDRGWL